MCSLWGVLEEGRQVREGVSSWPEGRGVSRGEAVETNRHACTLSQCSFMFCFVAIAVLQRPRCAKTAAGRQLSGRGVWVVCVCLFMCAAMQPNATPRRAAVAGMNEGQLVSTCVLGVGQCLVFASSPQCA